MGFNEKTHYLDSFFDIDSLDNHNELYVNQILFGNLSTD